MRKWNECEEWVCEESLLWPERSQWRWLRSASWCGSDFLPVTSQIEIINVMLGLKQIWGWSASPTASARHPSLYLEFIYCSLVPIPLSLPLFSLWLYQQRTLTTLASPGWDTSLSSHQRPSTCSLFPSLFIYARPPLPSRCILILMALKVQLHWNVKKWVKAGESKNRKREMLK